MFTVQIYCVLLEGIEINNAIKKHFNCNERLHPDNYKTLTFNSKSDLFDFVRKFDWRNRKTGIWGNYFLEAVMCDSNDTKRHEFFVVDHYMSLTGWSYYHGYLTKDAKGNIIDLRNFTKEIYRFHRFDSNACSSYGAYGYRRYLHFEGYFEDAEKDILSSKQNPKWMTVEEWKPYYRRFRTMQERRYIADKEHKPYIRGRRSKLPEPWGTEISIPYQRSWKVHTKVRRQWLVNKKVHTDTTKISTFKKQEFDLSIAYEEEIAEIIEE